MPRFPIQPSSGIKGYTADPSVAPPDRISAPSVNCMVNENGEVEQRLGYQVEDIDLGQSGKPARSFHIEKYDVTVFTVGTKVLYHDWNTGELYDTGLTLTDGTITRGDQFEGDLYLTNTTDGLRRLVFGRINETGADLGDGSVQVDYDMAARLSAFGNSTNALVIKGDSYAYNSVTVATGVVALDAVTLTRDYDDNSVCVVVHDLSGVSGIEKASKLGFWKRRMHLFGSEVAGNSDQPNNTIYYGQFTAPTTMEKLIVFDYATLGSTRELVGNYGRVTNVVPVQDYLYQFTDSEAYVTAADDLILSGSGAGTTTPDLKDPRYGCLNEDCATSLGNNEMAYITRDNRFMRIKLATENGAALQFPDESFDMPIRYGLRNMDKDQAGAMTWHYKAGRMTICQVRIGGQWYWYIWDHRIRDWQPPQQVITASSFFERNGVLYATDADDDTVYSIFTSFADNGGSIFCVIATGEFDIGDSMVTEVRVSGLVSQAAKIKMKAYVTNMNGGRRSGSEKVIDGGNFTYADDKSVGAVPVGGSTSTGETELVARWKASFDVFPSEGNAVQFITTQEMEGGYFRLSAFAINGKQYSNSFTPSK